MTVDPDSRYGPSPLTGARRRLFQQESVEGQWRPSEGGGSYLGLRFSQAQFLETRVGIGVWLIPGHKITCLFYERAMLSSCNTIVQAA